MPADVVEVVAGENFQRHEWESAEAFCVTRDTFANTGVSCAFVRFYSSEARTIDFRAQAGYQVASCPAGGWILKPTSGNQEVYWISQPPKYRLLDKGGHIISEKPASISGHKVTAADLSLQVAAHGAQYLDCVIWQLPAGEPDIVSDLEQLAGLEVQPIFTWSSHTVYQRPADVYLHLRQRIDV